MLVDLYNQKKEKAGTIEVSEKMFGAKWKPELVQQAVVTWLANHRQIVAHVKDRSEVRGGGKKPWRQKHTGRSRHGSSRSPLWAHGGVTFGPRNEKIFARKINKKMKQSALYSLLSKKLKNKEIYFADDLKIKEAKTKNIFSIIKNFLGKEKKSILFIVPSDNREFFLAGRNIADISISNSDNINIYDCISNKYIIMDKEAVMKM